MSDEKEKRIAKNTSMLLLLNIAKLVFPFITLPYLTRVMSTEYYGIVAYVKAVMSYLQIIVDFGFLLSATKKVVEAKENREILGYISGTILVCKIILAAISGVGLMIISLFIPILKHNMTYTFLSYGSVVLTIFLFDFLFRGIEKMHIITIRFVIMKVIATMLTFLFVKGDEDIILIPVLEICGSLVAVVWVMYELKKLGIKLKFLGIIECLNNIKESAVYFLSSVASTSFNVFNTIVLGVVLPSTEIAYWSVCMQIINAIQAVYTPISDAIYPEMIRTKDFSIIKRATKLFTPLILVGCILGGSLGRYGLLIVGGEKYINALPAFRRLIPVLLFGFWSIIYGWPCLGSIGKTRETTLTTVIASLFQILTVILLVIINKLTLNSMAITRSVTEIILFLSRYWYCRKYKNEFRVGITE